MPTDNPRWYITRELGLLFGRVGIPKALLTDQGMPFMSKLMNYLCRLLQMRHLRTSVYHPQTEGLLERFNQILKWMLTWVVEKEGSELRPTPSLHALCSPRNPSGLHRLHPFLTPLWTATTRTAGCGLGSMGRTTLPILLPSGLRPGNAGANRQRDGDHQGAHGGCSTRPAKGLQLASPAQVIPAWRPSVPPAPKSLL